MGGVSWLQHLAFFVNEEDAAITGGYLGGKYNSKTTSRVKHLGMRAAWKRVCSLDACVPRRRAAGGSVPLEVITAVRVSENPDGAPPGIAGTDATREAVQEGARWIEIDVGEGRWLLDARRPAVCCCRSRARLAGRWCE